MTTFFVNSITVKPLMKSQMAIVNKFSSLSLNLLELVIFLMLFVSLVLSVSLLLDFMPNNSSKVSTFVMMQELLIEISKLRTA